MLKMCLRAGGQVRKVRRRSGRTCTFSGSDLSVPAGATACFQTRKSQAGMAVPAGVKAATGAPGPPVFPPPPPPPHSRRMCRSPPPVPAGIVVAAVCRTVSPADAMRLRAPRTGLDGHLPDPDGSEGGMRRPESGAGRGGSAIPPIPDRDKDQERCTRHVYVRRVSRSGAGQQQQQRRQQQRRR